MLHPHIFALVFGLPPRIRDKRLIMTLHAFVDDSGSEPKGQVFVLAGYISTAERWDGFARRWDEICAESPAISNFKMASAWQLGGPYWRAFREDKREAVRDRKLLKLAQAVHDSVTCAFAVGMTWRAYESVVRERVPQSVERPYFFLFWRIIQLVAQWQDKSSLREKVDFVFDDQSKIGCMANSWHGNFLDCMTDGEKFMLSGAPTFKHDSDMLPLKAADMWAWSYRREVVQQERAKVEKRAYKRHPAMDILFRCPREESVIVEKGLRALIQNLSHD